MIEEKWKKERKEFDEMMNEVEKRLDKEHEEDDELKEREEYERLKEKFGG